MTVNTHVGFEIRVLSNLIYRRINQMSAQEGETLTANQDWVLHFLIQSQGRDIMQRDIEKEFSIRREPVSYDARMKKLVVTEKGAEARERMIDRLNRFEAELQSGISRDELNQLTRTIRKLEENIK